MDLKTLAKQYQEKMQGPKGPPPGMASVDEIAEALEIKPSKVTRILALAQVRRVGIVAKTSAAAGYSYYDLEQVAVALGLKAAPAAKPAQAADEEDD